MIDHTYKDKIKITHAFGCHSLDLGAPEIIPIACTEEGLRIIRDAINAHLLNVSVEEYKKELLEALK